MADYGMLFRRVFEPELLVDHARRAEAAGFDEFWVVEDLGYHGAFSQCVAALAVTERIGVGLGIAPAVVRNPAFLAMEWATTARLFPGRFHLGLGHGVERWMEQIGARPASWLGSLEEITTAARRLVAGERVSFDGAYVHLEDVELVFPLRGEQPRVSFGVRQPKSMALAGRVADGVILAECSGPRYVAEVRSTIGPDKRLTVFVNASADVSAADAEVDMRIAQGRFAGQMAVYDGTGIDLHREIVISGEPSTWREQSQRWIDAGADAVVWVPLISDTPDVIDTFLAAFAH